MPQLDVMPWKGLVQADGPNGRLAVRFEELGLTCFGQSGIYRRDVQDAQVVAWRERRRPVEVAEWRCGPQVWRSRAHFELLAERDRHQRMALNESARPGSFVGVCLQQCFGC